LIHTILERKHFKLEVHRQTKFLEDVCPILRTIKEERAIIYVLRRCDVEMFASELRESEIECTTYHAAKSKNRRKESLSLFAHNKVRVIVATNALNSQTIPDVQVK
jgi:superfamily II DNA helicase RecQ